MKNMKKKFLAILLAMLVLTNTPVMASVGGGGTPFQGFNYNHWADLVPAPAAYEPVRSFGLADISPELGNFSNPTDIHVDFYNNIYVVDRENHRIVAFDSSLNLVRVIDGFSRGGATETFNMPNSVYVTQDREIFIADTNNNRIVVLDWDGDFVREITAPTVEGLEDDFIFLPLHVLVDRGGRLFVIVQRVFEGIMSFAPNGDFLGYFGTISVNFNPVDMLWRNFMTEEQRSRQMRFIPTEFQAMSMDEYGFVFTTNIEPYASSDQVMRLNPRGENVLVNFNPTVAINGDQRFTMTGRFSGPAAFVDVVARSHGMYSTLDSTRGRVFTYDSEGNLLYVFSGTGNIQGMARRPVSIEMYGENLLMLDAGRNQVIEFAPTEYGRLINTAIQMRYDGHDAAAVGAWQELVRLDENFALAWSGIGRSLLAAGDNESAMYYTRRGADVRYFSIAFRRHRVEVIRDGISSAMTGATVLIVAFVGYKIFRKIQRSKAVQP